MSIDYGTGFYLKREQGGFYLREPNPTAGGTGSRPRDLIGLYGLLISRQRNAAIMDGMELLGPAAGRPANDEVVHQHGGRERLVFFIDLHDDKPSGVQWPTLACGSQGNLTLELFKQAVSLIVMTRSRMPLETDYSLCVLLESAVQLLDFTTDTARFLEQVGMLEGTDGFRSFDMSSVASILKEARQAPQSFQHADPSGKPLLVRGIFLYGRPGVVPTFGDAGNSSWRDVGCGPDMVLDVLFVHAKKTNDDTLVGSRSAVLEFVTDLDRPRVSKPFIFEHQLNPKRVLISAAQLAAHARQRPEQGLLLNHLSGAKAVQEPAAADIPMALPV